MPGLEDPDIAVEPFLTLYEFRGNTSMDSAGGPNVSQDLRTFGHDERDEGFGGRLVVGDGFSGIELMFMQVDNLTTTRGTIEADYGVLSVGDVVTTEVNLLELQGGYTGEIVDFEFDFRDEPVQVRWGLGGKIVHRQLEFVARDINGPIQRNQLDDNLTPYATTRLRFDYLDFGLQADYGINPDLDFGQELEGTLSDIEVRIDYTFDLQGVTVFGAYRRAELVGADSANGLEFEHDLALEGFTLGARVAF